MYEKLTPALTLTNFEEPIGNFMQIFLEAEISREELKRKIELYGTIKKVAPLEYFVNVGNGMNPQTQKQEIDKIIPNEVLDIKHRAEIALKYLESGHHIGISQEQYERDLQSGKNHDTTMRYFLENILSGKGLEPCVIVETKRASEIFGVGIDKVILDGTHRAVIAATVNMDLEVLEFSAD
jgi:hypothetical protein